MQDSRNHQSILLEAKLKTRNPPTKKAAPAAQGDALLLRWSDKAEGIRQLRAGSGYSAATTFEERKVLDKVTGWALSFPIPIFSSPRVPGYTENI